MLLDQAITGYSIVRTSGSALLPESALSGAQKVPILRKITRGNSKAPVLECEGLRLEVGVLMITEWQTGVAEAGDWHRSAIIDRFATIRCPPGPQGSAPSSVRSAHTGGNNKEAVGFSQVQGEGTSTHYAVRTCERPAMAIGNPLGRAGTDNSESQLQPGACRARRFYNRID